MKIMSIEEFEAGAMFYGKCLKDMDRRELLGALQNMLLQWNDEMSPSRIRMRAETKAAAQIKEWTAEAQARQPKSLLDKIGGWFR